MALPARDPPMLAAALEYARRGWAVIPLHTPRRSGCSCGHQDCDRSCGKHPRIDNWQNDGSVDPAVIIGWWRTWPDANVGVLTGKPSGFIALDVDPDSGGEESLAALEAQYGPLPRTETSRTGSGGKHFLFAYPGTRVKNSAKKIAPGLDIRGDGGQIVAPPSTHRSGKAYQWIVEADLADPPTWLLELLRDEPRQPTSPPPPRKGPTYVLERARRYIARMPPAISGSGGHDALWAVVLVAVRGFQLTTDEAFSLILTEYNPRCVPEWSERELRHKVSDAFTKSTLPWGYLLDPPQRHQQPPPRSREPGSDDGDEAPATKDPLLQKVPYRDFLAKKLPPAEWLVSPWLEAKSLALVVAPPNAGKTLFALYLTVTVAMTGKRVLFIEEEGSERGFQTRVRRAVESVGGNLTGALDCVFKPRLSLMHPDTRLFDEVREYDLTVIDSLARVSIGADENDAKDMGIIVNNLDRLRDSSGGSVVSLHHSGKGTWTPGRKPELSDSRGSGALAAGVDTILALVPLESPAGLVRFQLWMTKQREEAKATPSEVETLMTGPAAVVEVRELERESESAAELLARLLPLIPEHPFGISIDDLRKAARAKPERVREAVNLGDSQGVLGRNRRIGIFRNASCRTQHQGPTGSEGPNGEPVGTLSRPHTTCGSEGPTPNGVNWSDPTSAREGEAET